METAVRSHVPSGFLHLASSQLGSLPPSHSLVCQVGYIPASLCPVTSLSDKKDFVMAGLMGCYWLVYARDGWGAQSCLG
jgi:hypothetical protein